MEKILCTIDNLVIYVYAVTPHSFDYFKGKISDLEMAGKAPETRLTIGKGYSEYHYRLNVGKGGGGVTVGYKHNSKRENEESYDMRIEFNPVKNNSEIYGHFWDLFKELYLHHTKKIKSFDVAFDVPVNNLNLIAVSLTGRQRGNFKDTVYYGSPGNTGRLKIYNKKVELEEKQGVTITQDELTRIEYSYRFMDPLTIQWLSKVQTKINDEYSIAVLDSEKMTGEIKAAVLGIQMGYMKMSEFTRTTKTKIKKALENMEQLDLDHAYANARDKNMELIGSYFK